jgi:hypothetical protein
MVDDINLGVDHEPKRESEVTSTYTMMHGAILS